MVYTRINGARASEGNPVKKNIGLIARWTARLMGAAAVLFVLWMSGLFGGSEGFGRFSDGMEILIFALWPVAWALGLALAFKWEVQGAVISLAGLAGLFALRTDLLGNPFFLLFAVPGVLFLLAWKMSRRTGAV